jgi:hypothetical protein
MALPNPGREVDSPAPQKDQDSLWSLPSMFTLSNPEIDKQREEISKNIGRVLQEQQAGTQAEIVRRQQVRQQQAPAYDATQQAIGQPWPPVPERTPTPDAPSGPLIDPEQFKSFFGPMFLFSMLLGKAAKGDMVDGLNMLSSGIQGYVTGNKERAAADIEKWKNATEKALNDEHAKLARYREIIESRKYNIQSKMQMLQIKVMREDDKRMEFALQQQNWAATLQAYENQAKMLDRQSTSALNLYKTIKGFQDKEAAQAEHRREFDARELRLRNAQAGGDITTADAKYIAAMLESDPQAASRLNPRAKAKVLHEFVQMETSRGTTPAQINSKRAEYFGEKAAQRVLGGRAGAVELGITTAEQIAPLIEKASLDLKRSGIQKWNALEQAVQSGTASPELRTLAGAINEFINVYARTIGGGVPHEADKIHAREVIDKSFSHGDLMAALRILQAGMQAEKRAVPKARESLSEGYSGAGAGAKPAGKPMTATNPKTGQRIQSDDGGKTWHPMQ